MASIPRWAGILWDTSTESPVSSGKDTGGVSVLEHLRVFEASFTAQVNVIGIVSYALFVLAVGPVFGDIEVRPG